MVHFFFFFQAEDGIRDYKVTGVQTCALPILVNSAMVSARISCSVSHAPPFKSIAAKRERSSALEKSPARSEEHTSELQSPCNLVCRLLLEKKKDFDTALQS